MLFTVAKKSSFYLIANFCGIIFKRIKPDEYYLFSIDGYTLAVGRSLLRQQTICN